MSFKYDAGKGRYEEVLEELPKKPKQEITESILERRDKGLEKSKAVHNELVDKYLKPLGSFKVYPKDSNEYKEKVQKLYEGGRTTEVHTS